MKKLLLLAIKFYQRTLSPDHGVLKFFFPYGACKFQPTCSAYAYEAIAAFGIIKGAWLAAKRVGRCHPWQDGGFDPVKK